MRDMNEKFKDLFGTLIGVGFALIAVGMVIIYSYKSGAADMWRLTDSHGMRLLWFAPAFISIFIGFIVECLYLGFLMKPVRRMELVWSIASAIGSAFGLGVLWVFTITPDIILNAGLAMSFAGILSFLYVCISPVRPEEVSD